MIVLHQCLHHGLHLGMSPLWFSSGMSSARISYGELFWSLMYTVTWSTPWGTAACPVTVPASCCSQMTSQSFHSGFMTLGRMGVLCEVICLCSARVELFPNHVVKYLVYSHFKGLKKWGPGTSLWKLFCSLITLSMRLFCMCLIFSLTQEGYKELSLFKVVLHLEMIS